MLHLLGLDDNKLTYLHAGRHKQLSQFGGEVIQDLIADAAGFEWKSICVYVH